RAGSPCYLAAFHDRLVNAIGGIVGLAETRMAELDAERRRLERPRAKRAGHWSVEEIQATERRLAEIYQERLALDQSLVTEDEVVAAFGDFGPLWASLTSKEQVRLIQLLVERVEYNGVTGKIAV